MQCRRVVYLKLDQHITSPLPLLGCESSGPCSITKTYAGVPIPLEQGFWSRVDRCCMRTA